LTRRERDGHGAADGVPAAGSGRSADLGEPAARRAVHADPDLQRDLRAASAAADLRLPLARRARRREARAAADARRPRDSAVDPRHHRVLPPDVRAHRARRAGRLRELQLRLSDDSGRGPGETGATTIPPQPSFGRTVSVWAMTPTGPLRSCRTVLVTPTPPAPKVTPASKPTHSPAGAAKNCTLRSTFGNATSSGLALTVIPLAMSRRPT